MIESNRIRRIRDKDLDDLDIKIEMAPFVDRAVGPEKQGDCYVGRKFKMAEWQEEEDSSQKNRRLYISTLSLFSGPQIHSLRIVKPITRTCSASMTI